MSTGVFKINQYVFSISLYTHTHTHIHTHLCTHIHTHTNAHTHAHKRTHLIPHENTHLYIYRSSQTPPTIALNTHAYLKEGDEVKISYFINVSRGT